MCATDCGKANFSRSFAFLLHFVQHFAQFRNPRLLQTPSSDRLAQGIGVFRILILHSTLLWFCCCEPIGRGILALRLRLNERTITAPRNEFNDLGWRTLISS
jgi:hypothetical protein